MLSATTKTPAGRRVSIPPPTRYGAREGAAGCGQGAASGGACCWLARSGRGGLTSGPSVARQATPGRRVTRASKGARRRQRGRRRALKSPLHCRKPRVWVQLHPLAPPPPCFFFLCFWVRFVQGSVLSIGFCVFVFAFRLSSTLGGVLKGIIGAGFGCESCCL